MISRVADHCFWFGRYLERAEATARVLYVTSHLALDAELPPQKCWGPALIVSGEEPAFVTKFGAAALADGDAVQGWLTWDPENLSCIRQSIAAARDNARSIREVLSMEIWETVNALYLWIDGEAAATEYRERRFEFYGRIREAVQLCLGYLRCTMLHDPPLDFIWLGVQLERSGQTARFLDVHHHAMGNVGNGHQVVETALWLSILRGCSGFEPFVKRHRGIVTGDAVAKFLIFEPKFPRSVAYAVRSALRRLTTIRGGDDRLPGGRPLATLHRLDAWLTQRFEDRFESAQTHEILTHVVEELAEAALGIGEELLGYGPPAVLAQTQTSAPGQTQSQSATGTE